jgi:Domain of unknown function (DUF4440)
LTLVPVLVQVASLLVLHSRSAAANSWDYGKWGYQTPTRANIIRMRILLVAIFALTASASAQSPAPVEIVNLEQHLWTTMAEANLTTVRSLFTKDFLQVNDKIEAVDSLLVTLKRCKLESYELRDLQVRILSPDSALTAYNVVSSYACGDPEKPQHKTHDNNATTVWVREPNTTKWLVLAHTETPTHP